MTVSTDYVFGFTDAIKLVNEASKAAADRAKKAQALNDRAEVDKMIAIAMHTATVAELMVEHLKRRQRL